MLRHGREGTHRLKDPPNGTVPKFAPEWPVGTTVEENIR